MASLPDATEHHDFDRRRRPHTRGGLGVDDQDFDFAELESIIDRLLGTTQG